MPSVLVVGRGVGVSPRTFTTGTGNQSPPHGRLQFPHDLQRRRFDKYRIFCDYTVPLGGKLLPSNAFIERIVGLPVGHIGHADIDNPFAFRIVGLRSVIDVQSSDLSVRDALQYKRDRPPIALLRAGR